MNTIQLLVDIAKLLFDLRVLKPLHIPYYRKYNSSNKKLDKKSKKLIRRRLKAMFFTLKKDRYGFKYVTGIELIFSLNRYITQEISFHYIEYWKALKYIQYNDDHLESQSIIRIIKEDKIIESLSSC